MRKSHVSPATTADGDGERVKMKKQHNLSNMVKKKKFNVFKTDCCVRHKDYLLCTFIQISFRFRDLQALK